MTIKRSESTERILQEQNEIQKNQELVKKLVQMNWKQFNPNRDLPLEDVAWDCFTHLWVNNFFKNYDSSQSKLTYYIKIGVRNYLIDQERKKMHQVKEVSGDMEIGGNLVLFDMIDDSIAGDIIRKERYYEMVEVLKEKVFLKQMNCRGDKEGEFEEYGKVKLSHYTVMKLVMDGYSMTKIAEGFGVQQVYISSIYREAQERMRNIFEYGEDGLDVDEGFYMLREKTVEDKIDEIEIEAAVCPLCGKSMSRPRYRADGLRVLWCQHCKLEKSVLTGTLLDKQADKKNLLKAFKMFNNSVNIEVVSECTKMRIDLLRKKRGKFNEYFSGRESDEISIVLSRWGTIVGTMK